MNDRLAHLECGCNSAWTDYKSRTEDLLHIKTVDSLSFLTRAEFQRLYYHFAGVDEREQSIIFRRSIQAVKRTLKRALHKYNQSETTRNYFTTPFANQARQKIPESLPAPSVLNPTEFIVLESPVPSEPQKPQEPQTDGIFPALVLRRHGFRLRN